jgi:hypothetical protein
MRASAAARRWPSSPTESAVITDEGRPRDLTEIDPGDIVMLEHSNGRATEIRVVRRVFEEYSCPEW